MEDAYRKDMAKLYGETLLEDVVPFWENNSVDWEQGGYFSCLDRKGNVFDTDKFMWMQCRQVWAFSLFYNEIEKKDHWLKIAKNGADFLSEHGMDEDGNWYFSLNRSGQPLVQPYNIYSDLDACLGFGQYAKASGCEKACKIALDTFRNIQRRRENSKGKYSKGYPGTRPMLPELGIYGAMLITAIDMEWLFEEKELNQIIDDCTTNIFDHFLDKNKNLLFENISPDGSHTDCFEGRLITPGHSIEAMWYVMEAARRRNDQEMINKALDVALSEIKFGWDKEYGGIYYFLDADGKPPLQLEWDRKLWWVHLESLITFMMGYVLTGRQESLDWFKKIHDYTWSKFPDPDYGEWWGYLDRQGRPFIEIKGSKFKGCFHLPRALYKCRQIMAV